MHIVCAVYCFAFFGDFNILSISLHLRALVYVVYDVCSEYYSNWKFLFIEIFYSSYYGTKKENNNNEKY